MTAFEYESQLRAEAKARKRAGVAAKADSEREEKTDCEEEEEGDEEGEVGDSEMEREDEEEEVEEEEEEDNEEDEDAEEEIEEEKEEGEAGISQKKRGKYQKPLTVGDVQIIIRNHCNHNMSAKEIAQVMSRKVSTIETYLRKWKKDPDFDKVKPNVEKGGHRWQKFTDIEKEWVVAETDRRNGATLGELRKDFKDQFDKDISLSTINKIQNDHHRTTKNLYPEARDRNTPETIERRHDYVKSIMGVDRADLIYIDECGCGLNARRRRGKAKVGVKAIELRTSRGPNKTLTGSNVTMIGAFSPVKGMIFFQIRNGGTSGETYKEFMDALLRHPYFDRSRHIIDDNAGIHSAAAISEVLEAHPLDHLYEHLPVYSPQLNPIEQCWNQMKSYVRAKIREAEESGTRPALHDWMEEGVRRISKDNAESYMNEVFRHYPTCLDREPLH